MKCITGNNLDFRMSIAFATASVLSGKKSFSLNTQYGRILFEAIDRTKLNNEQCAVSRFYDTEYRTIEWHRSFNDEYGTDREYHVVISYSNTDRNDWVQLAVIRALTNCLLRYILSTDVEMSLSDNLAYAYFRDNTDEPGYQEFNLKYLEPGEDAIGIETAFINDYFWGLVLKTCLKKNTFTNPKVLEIVSRPNITISDIDDLRMMILDALGMRRNIQVIEYIKRVVKLYGFTNKNDDQDEEDEE